MPDPAAAHPNPTTSAPTARLERTYLDVLRRPMRGTVHITGADRVVHGGTVTVAATVTASLVDGVLSVDLPPGTYELAARLETVDGQRARETETVTLS